MADGAYRWMLDRSIAQRDAAGQVTQWLCTLTDIDDLKQATAHLEKNMSMNRIAGRVARLGGWTIELPDRTLNWSDENCVIHDVAPGYQPTLKEGIGYFFPEHQATVIQLVDACAQHGTPYDFVLPKLTAKGRQAVETSSTEFFSYEETTGEPLNDGERTQLISLLQKYVGLREGEAR